MDQPARVPGVDPSRVNTPAELAACLDGLRLRRGLSYEAMERAARNLPVRPGAQRWEPLGKSTIGEIVTGKRPPTRGKLLTFLVVCDVASADRAQWLAAWERAATAGLAAPAGAVRVREVRPRTLGVHAAIQVDGAAGDLPPYVPRDLDLELRAAMAAEAGAFLLLVGGSSVGKTRTLYEAVLATVPDWWLVHPDRDDPASLQALAATPTPRTVIWLDEFQRYLGALTAGTVRTLLRAGTLLVATIWPGEYLTRIVPHRREADDRRERERELLDLAQVFDVADAFTSAEHARARELAAVDGRIRAALDSADGGLTQVLAAAPELVRWWERAPDPHANAVITAAVDARRLGVERPLTAAFLAAAAPGYLTPAQRATTRAGWLRSALAYASTPLHGAVAALSPVDDGTVGGVAGYSVADYLLQHGQRTRATIVPSHQFWRAVGTHAADPHDLARLAHGADGRGLLPVAERLWRAAIAAGHPAARRSFAHDLEAQGRLAEAEQVLRDAVAAGEPHTRVELAHLVRQQGRPEEVEQVWRDGLSQDAAAWRGLVDVLADARRFEEAEALTRDAISSGDASARTTLGWLLEQQDRLDEAAQVLRDAAAQDPDGAAGLAWRRLAAVLARQGRHAEAERMLREAVAAGSLDARRWLAQILEDQGRHDDAEQVLRDAVASEDVFFAPSALFKFLERRGRTDEAEQVARDAVTPGDHFVRYDLIELLERQGRHGDAEQVLRAAIAGGRPGAWQQLAKLLERQGRRGEAEQIRRNGLDPDGSISAPPP